MMILICENGETMELTDIVLIPAMITAGVVHGIVKDRTEVFDAEYLPIAIKVSSTQEEHRKHVSDCSFLIEHGPDLDYFTAGRAGAVGIAFAPSTTLIDLAINGLGYAAIYLASMRIGRVVSKTIRDHSTATKREKALFETKLEKIIDSDISDELVAPVLDAQQYAKKIVEHHKNTKLYTNFTDAIELAIARSQFRQQAKKLIDSEGFTTLAYTPESSEDPQLYLIHRDMFYTLNPAKDVSSAAIVSHAEKFTAGYHSLIKRFTPDTQFIILKADPRCEFNSKPLQYQIAQTINQYCNRGDFHES